MKRYFLLVPVAIGMLAAAVVLTGSERESFPDLRLSDFPWTFKESTMIVIGSNASEIEIQAAEDIADYLKEKTGNKEVLIKKYSEISEEEKKNYNLIVVGTPKSNGMLREIYEMADVLRVNETFPGEGKGVLEIARNPWNEEKAVLLVEGGEEKGVLSSAVVSNILEYMWKPKKVFITYKLKKRISKQMAINISLKFLKNTSLNPDYIKLIVYPTHPDFTNYHIYNITSDEEIGYLEQLINVSNIMWLISYKLNRDTVLIFVNAENSTIVGVMKNVKVYRPRPKIDVVL